MAVKTKAREPCVHSGFPLPENLRATSELKEALSSAEVLVVGVPSHGFRALPVGAAPHVPHWIPGPLSRNRQVGDQLGKGESIDEIIGAMNLVAEGVKCAFPVMELAERYGVEPPICAEIRRVVSGEIPPPRPTVA